jgi:hypothetical protein
MVEPVELVETVELESLGLEAALELWLAYSQTRSTRRRSLNP